MPTSLTNVNPERRKTTRFRPAAPIVVHSLDTRVVMALDNLSPGGFSVQSTTELPTGAVMRIKFSAPDGSWTTLLIAQSVYLPARSRPAACGPGLSHRLQVSEHGHPSAPRRASMP
jgi:hypothetical protein